MNDLLLIVTSNLKNENDIKQLAKSIDISENIHLYFINQSEDKELLQLYKFSNCRVTEIQTKKVVPLSKARNIALRKIYQECQELNNTLVMFPDDDAWFPRETIDFLLNCKIQAYAIKTIDPILNKSFNKVKNKQKYVTGWHVVKDICSICIVVPLHELEKKKALFNEQLGLGNEISQGEESLFIYYLHSEGMEILNDNHLIFHPYKNITSIKNYYSMSYFWSLGQSHISNVFFIPYVKYLIKYTIALILMIKDRKYLTIFKMVWKGAFDGKDDKKGVLKKG